ncbi:MAG: hypothetical protein OER86_08620, partial [Phycisphaerae bacterium]|nr:hypothetical protein [Phycisphaerae bacterium]
MMKGGRSAWLVLWCGLALAHPGLSAGADDELTAKTIPLRAALHTDPTLDSPFERLVTEYRRAGRVPDLLAIYGDHLKQYPQDVNAHVVRLRLLQATNDATFLNSAAASAKTHPKVAYLRFLLFEAMEKRDPASALEHLDGAIENESRADRRGQWIERLLPLAIRHNRRPLARGRLEQLAQASAGSAEGQLRAAERMQKYGFGEMALKSLSAASALKPAPQIMVKIELTAAETEVGLERVSDASARLDRLLDKLTADYWQRPEIMRRRMALARDKPERQRLIEAARDRMRKSNYAEAAVLNLSELLAGFDQPQAALELLREAGSRRPQSVKIEKATLRLFDQLGEERGREQYLAQRIQDHPERKDLIYERIKTLYLLGRRDQAGRQLDGLVDRLPEPQRIEQLLAVSRFLRQSSLPRDAAALFERVSRAQPNRLDVRREAAEMLLALGQSTRARRLMAQPVPPDTSIENLLDAVQFMLNNRMYDPARRVLDDRLRTDKANLDLRLLAIRIHAKLFQSSAGEQMVQESRELADTVARYRRWLEASAAFHEEFFTTDRFLKAELENLGAEGADLTPAVLQRHLAFAEVAAQQSESEMALGILRGDLDRKPPKKLALELRRNLVRILEGDPLVQAEVQKQLAALAQEDPKRSSEYHARLALLHLRSKAGLGSAQALLPRIDIEKIEDPVLLDGLQPLILQQNDTRRILAMLRRSTALSPTNEKNWQKYVSALAWTGTEDELRVALRQLLAGIERMPLEEESIAELQTHLFASYWRQVVLKLGQGSPDALSDALASLRDLSRQSLSRNDAACVAWMQAYLAHRLGREA